MAGPWTYNLFRVLLLHGVLLWALSFQTRTPGCTWTPSSGEPLSPHGPWSACLQPSPCDLTRDSAPAFLVLAGLLSGSMGLPIKYPPISSPRIYLGRNYVGLLRLRDFSPGSTPRVDSFCRLLQFESQAQKSLAASSKMNSCN